MHGSPGTSDNGGGAGLVAAFAQEPTASTAGRDPGLYMTFQTDMGAISCKLFEKESPVTVGKMVGLAIGKISYVESTTRQTVHKKFFDGLTFHRVIPGFMIQAAIRWARARAARKAPVSLTKTKIRRG